MSATASDFRILRVCGNPVSWTLLEIPDYPAVKTIGIRHAVDDENGNAITPQDIIIRSDPDDPKTQDRIPAGYERTITYSDRFNRSAILWFRLAQGNGPIVVVMVG